MNREALFVLTLTVFATLGATHAVSARAGDLYKWTDAQGVVHYTDAPPPNNVKKTARVHAEANSNPDAAPAAPAEEKKNDANKPATTATLPDTPENRAKLCEQSRTMVDALQSKFPVADSSGKPLDDKARADNLVKAQQAASAYCGRAAS